MAADDQRSLYNTAFLKPGAILLGGCGEIYTLAGREALDAPFNRRVTSGASLPCFLIFNYASLRRARRDGRENKNSGAKPRARGDGGERHGRRRKPSRGV